MKTRAISQTYLTLNEQPVNHRPLACKLGNSTSCIVRLRKTPGEKNDQKRGQRSVVRDYGSTVLGVASWYGGSVSLLLPRPHRREHLVAEEPAALGRAPATLDEFHEAGGFERFECTGDACGSGLVVGNAAREP